MIVELTTGEPEIMIRLTLQEAVSVGILIRAGRAKLLGPWDHAVADKLQDMLEIALTGQL